MNLFQGYFFSDSFMDWKILPEPFPVSVTHNLSAFVAHKLSGQIITSEVVADGTNEVVTGDTDYEV